MKTVKDRAYSFNHTKERLLERYGIFITIKDYNKLCKKIKDNNGVVMVMMESQKGDTQYTYDLDFKEGQPIRVVWSNIRDCITTALERN
jgi:hypothetical protein